MFKTELQTIVEYLTPNTQHTVYNLESHLNTINNYILCKTNCRKY